MPQFTLRTSTLNMDNFEEINMPQEVKLTIDNNPDNWGKTLDMPQEKSWEEQFDKKFTIKSNADTLLLRYTDAQDIKSFIRNLRQQDRDNLLNEVAGLHLKIGQEELIADVKDIINKIYE